MQKTIKTLVLFLGIATLVGGCTALDLLTKSRLQKPEFKYIKHTVAVPTLEDVIVNLEIDAYNPNAIGLKNIFLDYELGYEGKRVVSGQRIELQLAPQAHTTIPVPVKVVYKEIYNAVGPAVRDIIIGKNSLPLDITLKIYGNPTVYNDIQTGNLFSFSHTINQRVDVPIPKDQIKNKINENLDKLKKLF